jgi:hypothetical protein
MTSHASLKPRLTPAKSIIAGGLIVLTAIVLLDLQNRRASMARSRTQVNDDACQEFVQTEATLSRAQLAQLLTIPERDSKERVREVVAEPYCRLAQLTVRAGVNAEREAYPLEFDPKTQLVILYEDNEYAGYRFNYN